MFHGSVPSISLFAGDLKAPTSPQQRSGPHEAPRLSFLVTMGKAILLRVKVISRWFAVGNHIAPAACGTMATTELVPIEACQFGSPQ